MWLAFAALSSMLYGTADFLGGLATRRASALVASLLSQAFGLVLLIVAAPFVPAVVRPHDLSWGAASGVAGGLGVLLLYRSLALYTVSTVAPMISIIALGVPVAAGVLAGERLGLASGSGIVLGAIAVALVSSGGDDATASDRNAPRGVPLVALASGVLVGLFLVCLGHVQSGSGLWPLVLGRLTGIGCFLLIALVRRMSLSPPRDAVRPILGAGICDVFANTLYVLSVQTGPLSLVATIVSLAPAATVVLAQAVFHERLAVAQKAGVALALVAVALLAQGSGH